MLEIIKRTGVFLIIAETLYQFVQENRYARYVRLLIRIMTLAILIVPILEFFKSGSSDSFFGHLTALESEFERLLSQDEVLYMEDEKASQEVMLEYDDEMSGMVTSETESYIKSICNNCALEYGYKIMTVSVNEERILFDVQPYGGNPNESELGSGTEAESRIEDIDEIRIEIDEGEEQTQKQPQAGNSFETEDAGTLKRVFAELLSISDTKIEVIIHEGA